MKIEEYAEKLRDAHFGELVGEILFREMAILFPDKAKDFQALSIVEHFVGNALGELLERYQVRPVEKSRVTEFTGHLLADIQRDDWNGWLLQFREILKPFVQEFDDLHIHSPTSDLAQLRLLRDHERMLLHYVDLEIAGHNGLSVIQSFLESFNYRGGR
ncbi:hypothetical protein [Rhizobium leguminosarum]|uniref:hypothetical protein n=1 Tax=Rhizobium leguminosarum TaxID=384 RepID=UPI001441A2C9|nr:hypothetical protein [Rhizobium leguminosarum]MBY5868670.1 hypothetical protein [Rhizobium leguminosarum]NKM08745.1 hypothetical protein [Rhizobium leguminosarum bv. viciae]